MTNEERNKLTERLNRVRAAITKHVFDDFKQVMLLRDLDVIEAYCDEVHAKEIEALDKLMDK